MTKKLLVSGLALVGGMLLVGGQAHALTLTGNATGMLQGGSYASTSIPADASTSLEVQAGIGTGASASSGMSGMAGMGMQGSLGVSIPAIQTNADLTSYNNAVIQSRPAVNAIDAQNDGSVAIHYSQPARFLGIFPASISGEVDVDAQGNTAVHLPWYAFLYSKDTTSVQTSAAAAVQESGANFDANAQT